MSINTSPFGLSHEWKCNTLLWRAVILDLQGWRQWCHQHERTVNQNKLVCSCAYIICGGDDCQADAGIYSMKAVLKAWAMRFSVIPLFRSLNCRRRSRICSVDLTLSKVFILHLELWAWWTIVYYTSWPSLSSLFYFCICETLEQVFTRESGGEGEFAGGSSFFGLDRYSDQIPHQNSIKWLDVTLYLRAVGMTIGSKGCVFPTFFFLNREKSWVFVRQVR